MATIDDGHGHDDPQPPPPPPMTIHASLFFDGTENNRANIDARNNISGADNYQHYILQEAQDTGNSYHNDYTNISKLEERLVKRPATNTSADISIYIEGIGTTNNQDDSDLGLGFGDGATGIPAKVSSGISQLISEIKSLVADKSVALTLNIDTFGFSRGAAAARNCVYCLMNDSQDNASIKTQLQQAGYNVAAVNIIFVGLFDTVASYGVNVVANTNDASTLHLNAIAVASKVFQIAAADEHRENFPLTNIDSAGGKGTQIFLPGVHSDIGGGYCDNASETAQVLLRPDTDMDSDSDGDDTDSTSEITEQLNKAKAALVAGGWYLDSELDSTTNSLQLQANRTGIRNSYNRIPLQLMVKNSIGLNFGTIATTYAIPDDLNVAWGNLQSGVKSGIDWQNDPQWVKDLRHKYFHFSAYYQLGLSANEPRFVPPDDQLNGQRTRDIHSDS